MSTAAPVDNKLVLARLEVVQGLSTTKADTHVSFFASTPLFKTLTGRTLVVRIPKSCKDGAAEALRGFHAGRAAGDEVCVRMRPSCHTSRRVYEALGLRGCE